jgi:sugar phosphate isomerase/epimerase
MNLFDRIGIDVGRKLVLEDAVEWAAEHCVRYIDIQLDTGDNALGTISGIRGSRVRALCERHGVTLGLHTASAVNVAEYAPIVADAVEAYLKAYVDASVRLGAKWIVMHAGFHFTSDKTQRMREGRERLRRVIAHAENKGALILLENLNKEPESPKSITSRIRSRNGDIISTPSIHPRSRCLSPPTTRIWCRRGYRALLTRSI